MYIPMIGMCQVEPRHVRAGSVQIAALPTVLSSERGAMKVREVIGQAGLKEMR